MFDLERDIDGWRQRMLAAGISAPVPLEELEGHLREEIERQMRTGLSAHDAFEAAVLLLGPAGALKSEFEKSSGSAWFLRPGFLSAFCWMASPLILLVDVWSLRMDEPTPAGRFGGFVTILAALYIGGLPFLRGRLPSAHHQYVQEWMFLGAVCVITWPILATGISLGVVDIHVGGVPEMILRSAGAAWFATWLAYAVSGQPMGLSDQSFLRPSRAG